MEEDVQHDTATQLFGVSTTGSRGAVPSRLANVDKLTNFALAHKQGADQPGLSRSLIFVVYLATGEGFAVRHKFVGVSKSCRQALGLATLLTKWRLGVQNQTSV